MAKQKFEMHVYQYRKLNDPNKLNDRYIAYVNIKEIRKFNNEWDNWLSLNPRSQNLDTNVSKTIKTSLLSSDKFHILNRGMLFSAKNITFNNKDNIMKFEFDDPNLHGNIDGGHTLRNILEIDKNKLKDVYVLVELIENVEDKIQAIELAEARNTSAAVDMKSIENLKGSFDTIKEIIKNKDKFKNRIRFKMFEKGKDSNTTMIDVRELIAIMNVFNSNIYDPLNSTDHPMQSYSGKEVSLRKFIDKYTDTLKRNDSLLSKKEIWDEIFDLWDAIELQINKFAKRNKKQFAAKYSFVDLKDVDANASKFNYTKWNQKEIKDKINTNIKTFKIPSGIIYPIISSFRVLLNEKDKYNKWELKPLKVWEKIGPDLVQSVINHLENSSRNPEKFAKNKAVWDSLYDKVKTYKQKIQIENLLLEKEKILKDKK